MTKQRIEIRNFGPLKHVDLDISDYTLFIGPNASGKSTIAKLVYFCRSLVRSFSAVVPKLLNSSEHLFSFTDVFQEMEKFGSYMLKNIFDFERLQNDFEVHFFSNDSENKNNSASKLFHIFKSPSNNHEIEIKFDEYFKSRMEIVFADFLKFYNGLKIIGQNEELAANDAVLELISTAQASYFIQRLGMNNGLMLIPSGRQALAIPRDERPTFAQDFFMSTFYEYTVEQKKEFRESISQIVQKEKKRSFELKLIENLELIQNLSEKILKGKYLSARDDERIYFDEKQYVKLYEASSGQQESLWILNTIFSQILSQQERFTVIEEPEAHLYPETQKHITELISLLANQKGNQVMITTHSPYILSALNNLLYAHRVGKSKPDEVAEIIDPLLWIDIDRVAAYVVEDGGIRDIMDRELGMINAEEIDSASRIINKEFERILNLED